MSTVAVILAAGSGSGMKSVQPTVLHTILGDPALLWVLRTLPPSVTAAVVAVHPGLEQVAQALDQWTRQGLLPCPTITVEQSAPGETAHAIRALIPELDRLGATRVLILCGDAPLLEPSTAERLASATGLCVAQGSITSSLDERLEAMACALPWQELRQELLARQDDNIHDLADTIEAVSRRMSLTRERCEPKEVSRMASRLDQSRLQALAKERINTHWMEEGVTFQDAAATAVGPRVTLGRDVLLEPMVKVEGAVTVGENTRIGQGSVIRDSLIGAAVDIRPYCVIQQADVAQGVKLGPFAHLREGSILHENVHVGNFVETKKAVLHAGAKANHLSYLGDAEVGERTNIGAGFISCNYDGFNKHRTVIGKDVFVGSDVQLVAPVTLGDGAIIGAGSTITRDVPADALALTRAPLVVKDSAAGRLREKLRAKRNQG